MLFQDQYETYKSFYLLKVKLVSNNSEVWNALAHVFWKKHDLNNAKICYERATEIVKN